MGNQNTSSRPPETVASSAIHHDRDFSAGSSRFIIRYKPRLQGRLAGKIREQRTSLPIPNALISTWSDRVNRRVPKGKPSQGSSVRQSSLACIAVSCRNVFSLRSAVLHAGSAARTDYAILVLPVVDAQNNRYLDKPQCALLSHAR